MRENHYHNLHTNDPSALDSQVAGLASVARLADDASPDEWVRREAVLAWLA